jgi:hypothetical protein
MKKRFSILIFTAIYLVSLSAGFLFAGMKRAAASTPPANESRQANWVLIRVNDMTLEKPQLVSVWVMFLTFSPGPHVFFKPIYSAEMANTSASQLASQFSVSIDRSLSAKFMAELDHMNIKRTGLVILDDDGFQNFTSWFQSPASSTADKSLLIPSTGKTELVSPEAIAYSQVCAALRTNEILNPADLPWKTLVPGHLLPHPSLESLASVWSQVMLSSTPAHCEVIPEQ